MTDPSQDTPPSLVERLRKTASHLAAGCVIPAKPHDGSDDPSDPVDDVTFEVEELRDLASLYATAADALVAQASELASRDERIALLESQIGATRGSLDALHTVLTGLLNAEPALDLEVFPVDPTTGEHKLEGEGGLEMAARLLLLAAERGAFRQAARPGQKLEAVDARFVEIHFLAEPCRVGLRFEGVPFDVRVPNADAKALLRSLHEDFINDRPDEAARKAEFFKKLHDDEVARQHHADLRHAMGHTARKPTDESGR